MLTTNPISLLVNLLVAGIVIYGIYWFLGMLALPDKIRQIAMVIIALVALFWLLKLFGLY